MSGKNKHNILVLRGEWVSAGNPVRGFSGPRLPAGAAVDSAHIRKLIDNLVRAKKYWDERNLIRGILIQVHYRGVVAKSNRITRILNGKSNETIRGATFQSSGSALWHVMTHLISRDDLNKAINDLKECYEVVERFFSGCIGDSDFDKVAQTRWQFSDSVGITRSNFLKIIKDAYYVNKFDVQASCELQENDQNIVTFYRTDETTESILSKLGIHILHSNYLNDVSVSLNPEEQAIVQNRAPYLVSMSADETVSLDHKEEGVVVPPVSASIPDPKDEPVVGVIDTLFDEGVYFAKWVNSKTELNVNIPREAEDYIHGTAICSIIVDGCHLNRDLNDGCGRFRVKHFGVAKHGGSITRLSLLAKIREIVETNPDIKVWNLSLGSEAQCPEFTISPDAAELDRLQRKHDAIFVVAGTNKPSGTTGEMRVGVPADSLNSVVVNAVNSKNQQASYSRCGPVLGFFYKPDISCFGGDSDKRISLSVPNGQLHSFGTSYAAPWITRKLAFLIYKMGFTREAAKALLIDAARRWDIPKNPDYLGHGVVPQNIEDILQTESDEIRFVLTGQTSGYETYNFDIPVPFEETGHPFFARATLCYFPECSREQGVDYTSTELDLHFGRLKEGKNSPKIHSINANYQGDPGFALMEAGAREYFRKWDNVKVISDIISSRPRPKKRMGASGKWGVSIKSKERNSSKDRESIPFAVVVTLKEINGKDRFDDFVKRCKLSGWIVQQVNVENMLRIHEKSNEQLFVV